MVVTVAGLWLLHVHPWWVFAIMILPIHLALMTVAYPYTKILVPPRLGLYCGEGLPLDVRERK